MERAYDDAKYGRFSRRPYIDCIIPTLVDPSMAPPGKHVMSCFVQYAPYHLADGAVWDDAMRDAFGEAVLDVRPCERSVLAVFLRIQGNGGLFNHQNLGRSLLPSSARGSLTKAKCPMAGDFCDLLSLFTDNFKGPERRPAELLRYEVVPG